MLIIAILLVAIALGLVTGKDPSILTNIAWFVALVIVNEEIIRRAYKDLKVRNFLSENVTINLACLFGWVYGAYVETLIVSLIFQASERFQIYLINLTMDKIDKMISPVKLGRKEIKDNEYEMISLEDIDIGDIIACYVQSLLGCIDTQSHGTERAESTAHVFLLRFSDLYVR